MSPVQEHTYSLVTCFSSDPRISDGMGAYLKEEDGSVAKHPSYLYPWPVLAKVLGVSPDINGPREIKSKKTSWDGKIDRRIVEITERIAEGDPLDGIVGIDYKTGCMELSDYAGVCARAELWAAHTIYFNEGMEGLRNRIRN